MNPAPSLQGSLWSGNQQLATKKQLISSISGLYTDIQDISISSITATNLNVSTLTAFQYISTPELYVSSIIGGGLQVNDGFLQISTGDFALVSLSTLQFGGLDLGGLNFSFDLGLGNAIGGFLGGLGALVGGVAIGLGTGVGLGIQGITNGLFSLGNTRSDSTTNINSNVFETINGTTQLQISTLGNSYPFYSSIFRLVSSISPNSVPGQEIFLSTIFPAGTTCVRSVSDPIPLLTTNSTINTSTIQSFGEWTPFLDPSVTGEDIFARNATFSTLVLNPPGPGALASAVYASNSGGGDVAYWGEATNQPTSYSFPFTSNNETIANSPALYYAFNHNWYANTTLNFISSPYLQYTSSIGNSVPGGIFFIQSTITSSLTSIPKFTYVGNALGGGNFAICEEDESNFLSTATMDFIAQSSNILVQWGLAVDNRNSTIGVGTSKRVTWDNTANTSNFIDIPVPQSTIANNFLTAFSIKQHPLETELSVIAGPDTGLGGQGAMNFNITRACFGGNTTAFNNQSNYPYQFNGNLFVNGVVEADTIIALSSFTSTNVVTYFSTFLLEADEAYIDYCQVSTLYSTDLIGGNAISSFGIEVYNALTQFTYVSTLVVDFQIFEGTDGNVTANLNKIQGTIPGSRVTLDNGNFKQISTTNLATSNIYLSSGQQIGLTNIYNYPGAITALTGSNTAPVVGLGFKAQQFTNDDTQTRVDYNYNQITGTSNGANFYPLATFDPTTTIPNLWSLSNINSLTTSTMNTNVISSFGIVTDSIEAVNNAITPQLFYSTITIPQLTPFLSYVFDSNTNTYVSSLYNSYVSPTTEPGRTLALQNFFGGTISTSGFTTLTPTFQVPMPDKMCRLDFTCSYGNANRPIKAGVAVFIDGIQGNSQNVYQNTNPADYLYSVPVSMVIDPTFFGGLSNLTIAFFLSGAPQVGEIVSISPVTYSIY